MSGTEMVQRRIDEEIVPGRRLGRHICHDPRSRNFPADTAARVVSVTHGARGLPLNQGTLGSCTANALCGALNSTAKDAATTYDENNAITLYGKETALEGQPYPPNDPGGNGLMVCKAARELGWISSYAHAFGLENALLALVKRPVITGVNWYTSFDTPDATGLVEIAPGATVRGGHEVVADGIDAVNEVVWLWNSWGTGWGVGGKFCWSFSTWEQLLSAQGDVTVPEV